MERYLIANSLVPDNEVWVSPATWENPFSLRAKESTATDLQPPRYCKDCVAFTVCAEKSDVVQGGAECLEVARRYALRRVLVPNRA